MHWLKRSGQSEASLRSPSLGGREAKALAVGPHRELRRREALLGSAKPWGNLRGETRPLYEEMSPPALVSDRMEETSVPPPSLPLRPRGKAIHLPRFIQDLPNPYNDLFFSISGAPAATSAPSQVRGYGSIWEMPPKPISIFPSILCS